MKIVAQSVPPEYAAQMKTYMQFADAGAGTTGPAKKNSGLARASVSRRAAKRPGVFERAADYIANDLRKSGSPLTYKEIYDQVMIDLINNDFTQPFWTECPVQIVSTLRSTPTSTPRLTTKPYAYRDPANLPTIPDYPAGTMTGMPMHAEGETSSGYFQDTILDYTLYTASMGDTGAIPIETPVFWQIFGDLHAYASTRGARPLKAIITKVQRCMAGEPPTTNNMPPVITPRYVDMRYALPPAHAPYWDQAGEIKAVITAAEPAIYTTAPDFDTATIQIAPAPLFGQWFNNNTYTRSQIEPEVYCFKYNRGGWIEFSGNLPLVWTPPYENCNGTWSPCNGFYGNNGQSSITMNAGQAARIIAIRGAASGHIEYGYTTTVRGEFPPDYPPPTPPDPPMLADPFTATSRIVFYGNAGTILMVGIGNADEPNILFEPTWSNIRVAAGGDPSWFPFLSSIDVLLSD